MNVMNMSMWATCVLSMCTNRSVQQQKQQPDAAKMPRCSFRGRVTMCFSKCKCKVKLGLKLNVKIRISFCIAPLASNPKI